MTKTNPFKFGSVVDEPYFTNRVDELQQINNLLKSRNHLILISPRRYGKTSLMLKAVKTLGRPYIFLDLQLVTDTVDFASQLLKRLYRVYPFERIKQFIKSFRIVPTLNLNPLNNEVDISFQPVVSALPLLEDVFNLIEKLGNHTKSPVVILDEFQDIFRIEPGLDKQLRAIIQHHKNVNYAFLGSMESMMHDIFEKKKSAFYHFGQMIPLGKIPYDDFKEYLVKGFKTRCSKADIISEGILSFTGAHPYYTQQLAFTVWDNCKTSFTSDQLIDKAIIRLVQIHDMDYERLWQTQNQTDKKVLIALSLQPQNILSEQVIRRYSLPATSTVFSSLKRLMKQGYVIKSDSRYELDDPFFARWIKRRREE
jgi:hypothetical protein